MNYHNISHDDMLNGPGLRTVLWVAGCDHHCKGCQNPETWDCCSGIPFDEAAEEEFFSATTHDYISGVTFSGGDPLHLNNQSEIERLAMSVRKLYPDKNIWCYTGSVWEDVKELPLMKYMDVLVDGPFKIDLSENNVALHWKGSSNQRVIDVQASLRADDVVLFDEGLTYPRKEFL